MQKLILFDFDGTLADTIPQITRILCRRAEEAGLGSLSKAKLRRFRSWSSEDIVKSFDIGRLHQLFLMVKCQRELGKHIAKAKLAKPALRNVLAELKAKGNCLGIVTTNSKKNVLKFIEAHKLPKFDLLLCRAGILGKVFAIKRAMRRANAARKNTIYVTDEVRDVNAAKSVGIKSVAVTWGFNTKEALRKSNPSHLISTASQLRSVLNQ